MACFAVTAAEAAVVTIVTEGVKLYENRKAQTEHISLEEHHHNLRAEGNIPWSQKLSWLCYLLWGGAFLLAFEHIWHGEVTPFFPFLTAASNPADMAVMLHEMATVGVTMAAIVTAVWAVMVLAASVIVKRPVRSLSK